MMRNILKKLKKPLSLDYATKYLRNKGLATHVRDDNNVTFKLYDMNWDLYCEKGRFGLRSSFNLGDDINLNCMLESINKLNTDRWIVKFFIETYTPDENVDSKSMNKFNSIIFSFESLCYSETDFDKTYEFAIYAITDGIEFHRKLYSEILNEHNSKRTNPIGFHPNQKNINTESSPVDNKNRRRIGFHQ